MYRPSMDTDKICIGKTKLNNTNEGRQMKVKTRQKKFLSVLIRSCRISKKIKSPFAAANTI